MAEFLYLYRGSERVNGALSPQQKDYLQRFQGSITSLTKAARFRAAARWQMAGEQ